MNDICTVGELKEALKDIPNDVYLAERTCYHQTFHLNMEYSKIYLHQKLEINKDYSKNPEFIRKIRKDILDKLDLAEIPSLVELVDENSKFEDFQKEIRKHCDDYLIGDKLMNAYDILGEYEIDMDVLKQIATPTNMLSISEELLRKLSE